MHFFNSCVDSSTILCSSFEENAILGGVTDVIVVMHKDNTYKSTPFLASFGPQCSYVKETKIYMNINGTLIPDVTFSVDQKGYIHPQKLTDKQIRKMNLTFGKNVISYRFAEAFLKAEIYLFSDNDKLIVSDVDGTVTKNDLGGHFHNFCGNDYLHEGYAELCKKIDKNGYKIVWLTMRAMPLYQYSKNYLRSYVGVDGAIMMEPEQFFNALSNEVLKKTGNIKANMMKLIRNLFSTDPFIGGLGNRENDAVAYYQAGINLDQIFIIDTKSRVQQMHTGSKAITYHQMAEDIEQYFPKYNSFKVGYK